MENTVSTEQTSQQEQEARNFFIRTYLKEADVKEFIRSLSVAKWAYIQHDERDNKEPHMHLLLRMNNRTSKKSIERKLKLFSMGKDEGKDCNFNCQICEDLNNAFLYLTHESLSAKQEGKAVYSVDDIRTNDFGYFRGNYSSDGEKTEKAGENTAYQIIADIERGETLRNMAKRYGREYIINRRHYEDFVYEMRREEGEMIKPKTKEQTLRRLYDLENEYQFLKTILQGD